MARISDNKWRRRIRQFLDSFYAAAEVESKDLRKYGFLKGDTFQIYSVKGARLYKHVDLEDYPITMARSVVFEKWIRPVLSEIENKSFCVHLGDSPCDEMVEGMPNLCYCKKNTDKRDLRLIPDTYYQGQKGYTVKREYRKLYKTRWEDKVEKAIFRGAYTGEKPFNKNMRAQLCKMNSPLIDAKITGVNNEWEKEEVSQILGVKMTKYQMAQYKYQIDIDGNTSSWDGLFWKLMSGSLTFKFLSEWQQWYYTQIEDGTHYVQINDCDDLLDKLQFYKKK